MKTMVDAFRARTGPLTRELERLPATPGLPQLPVRLQPQATTDMVCGYCSTGCGLSVHLREGEAVNLSPASGYPVNRGMACPKGWEALTVLDAPDRAVTPLLKNARGQFEPVDWHRAMQEFTTRLKAIQAEHGPHAVAFLSTGQIVTEEMALLGALAKFGMGMLHGDGNTRQCMATAVVAYKQAFGFDATPYTYADLEASDVIVLVGSNLCIAHPILWERVMRNPHHPDIVVVDPRMTETAMNATQHLALAPKSDQTLLYGVARILIEHGWIDADYIAAHTSGFEEFHAFAAGFTLERVAADTGLSPAQIERFAQTIHEGARVSFWWTMGVNQSHQGVRTAQAIINLALLTGNMGRPGTGANSITGQCNAMGSRLFSNTTCLLGGHDFTSATDRKKVARHLQIDPSVIPAENSWAYPEILEGILRGQIRGLWIVCTNPAHSWINQRMARDILSRLDFLVVQDMYHSTETAQLADLVLPAAGWGEKEGTFINSERRIGLVKAVRRPPGQALSDFRIFQLIAHAWGCGEMFARWSSPAAVFAMLRELTRDMPCDISGITDYAMIERHGGIQWPCPDTRAAAACERRLFEDGRFFHPDGRARMLFEAPRPLTEPLTPQFPLMLLTGRGSAAQWHTQTRTAKSAVLQQLAPEHPFIEVNPHDARRLGIQANDRVTLRSPRGTMHATAFLTHNVQAGQVFIPMHYEATNRLTDAVFDPYSRQPAYKACAVSITRGQT
jgi:assimilatory nitrate reductase catalytic subunit